MNLFELFIKIAVDDDASGNIDKLSQKMGKGLKTAAKIGVAAVGTASTAIAALTKQSVDAYAEYEVAKKQIEELSKTYLESVDAILTPAKEAVKKAEEERYAAIRKFNSYYGAYQTVLTGDRAAKEMIRAINEINSIQRKIWNNTFWF